MISRDIKAIYIIGMSQKHRLSPTNCRHNKKYDLRCASYSHEMKLPTVKLWTALQVAKVFWVFPVIIGDNEETRVDILLPLKFLERHFCRHRRKNRNFWTQSTPIGFYKPQLITVSKTLLICIQWTQNALTSLAEQQKVQTACIFLFQ